MTGRLIQVTENAYQYPLLIKQLWHTPFSKRPIRRSYIVT